MIRPPLESTPLGMNTTIGTTSPIDFIPVRTKTPEPMPLTPPTDFPEQNIKAHVQVDPEPDPSLSDSSLNKSNSSKDRNYSKLIKKINTRNRTRQTHLQAILVRLTRVTTDASDVKIRAIGKQIRSNYAHG